MGRPGMSRRRFAQVTGLAAAGVIAWPDRLQATEPTADLVLTNGRIHTIDPADSVAEGVAVRGGRILAVGPAEAVQRLVGTTTRVLDLGGRAVTPGLVDSHAHLGPFGNRENGWFVNLQGLYSKEEVLEALAQRARRTPAGGWVRAWGVESNSHSFLDRESLDGVSRKHPILVFHTGGQWGFANSLALQLAAISKETADPPGARIGRALLSREPSGLLLHYPALNLVQMVAPALTDVEAREAILYAARLYAAEGVTCINDNFLYVNMAPHFHRAYGRLAREGTLPVRVKIWPYFPNLEIATKFYNALARADGPLPEAPFQEIIRLRRDESALFRTLWGGAKMAVDGFPLWYQGQTAFPMHRTDELGAMVRLFHRAGDQISIHAVGDQAVDLALDAWEAAWREFPRQDCRYRIEHAIAPKSASLDRMARLGVVVSTHPQWIYGWGDKWAPPMWQRPGVFPLRDYLRKGIPIAMGADPPAFPIWKPQIGLWQATARTTKGGRAINPDNSIGIRQALRVQSLGSAYAAFQERELGSIEAGKLADLVVWDHDFTAVPTGQIPAVKAELTLLGGEVVYKRPGTALTWRDGVPIQRERL